MSTTPHPVMKRNELLTTFMSFITTFIAPRYTPPVLTCIIPHYVPIANDFSATDYQSEDLRCCNDIAKAFTRTSLVQQSPLNFQHLLMHGVLKIFPLLTRNKEYWAYFNIQVTDNLTIANWNYISYATGYKTNHDTSSINKLPQDVTNSISKFMFSGLTNCQCQRTQRSDYYKVMTIIYILSMKFNMNRPLQPFFKLEGMISFMQGNQSIPYIDDRLHTKTYEDIRIVHGHHCPHFEDITANSEYLTSEYNLFDHISGLILEARSKPLAHRCQHAPDRDLSSNWPLARDD
jgi:hypothetical protein